MLLEAGADPTRRTLETNVNDNEMNRALTPLELAKDEKLRALLSAAAEEKGRALVADENEASESQKDAERQAMSADKDEV